MRYQIRVRRHLIHPGTGEENTVDGWATVEIGEPFTRDAAVAAKVAADFAQSVLERRSWAIELAVEWEAKPAEYAEGETVVVRPVQIRPVETP